MKIKRFEASSMSEALRMVRKEFGENAVILSAKNVKKPGRLFGKGSDGAVIVTAAIDRTPSRPAAGDAAQETSAGGSSAPQGYPPEPPERAGQGISRYLQHFTPITRTGQQKLQPKLIRLMSAADAPAQIAPIQPPDGSFCEQLREQGLDSAVCAELTEKMAELMPEEEMDEENVLSLLSEVMEVSGWVAPMHSYRRDAARVIALVGAHGAGKTTTAAKLAAHFVLNTEKSVALLSLDDHRIDGTTELQRYAGIIGVPFEVASDPQQARMVLNRLAGTHLVIVDTPGLSPDDKGRQTDLLHMLDSLDDPEIHLLMQAGAQEQVMVRTIECYKSLNIQRLLPTHVDWCRQFGPFFNLMARHPWPITYMATGPRVPEDLVLLTARYLAAMLLGGRRVDTGQRGIQDSPAISAATRPGQYVANRNSDIFHDRSCKSVQRMNDDNILVFKDPMDAIGQGFKPCRMCCMAHFAPKPIVRQALPRLAGSRN